MSEATLVFFIISVETGQSAFKLEEHSGSVVECLTGDQGVAGSSLHFVLEQANLSSA